MAIERWGDDENRLWDRITDNFGDSFDDMHARVLFDAGWIEGDLTSDQRGMRRDAFLDYMISQEYFQDREDFDWEEWRDFMGYGRV